MEKFICTEKGDQWEAFDPQTGERTLDSTREDAVKNLRQKIYMSNVFQNQPMPEIKLLECRNRIIRDIKQIEYTLKKDKIIVENEFTGITARIMTEHCSIIQEELEKTGYKSRLEYVYVFQGNMKRYAIYNSNEISNHEAEKLLSHYIKG